jgi:hypothetical protein
VAAEHEDADPVRLAELPRRAGLVVPVEQLVRREERQDEPRVAVAAGDERAPTAPVERRLGERAGVEQANVVRAERMAPAKRPYSAGNPPGKKSTRSTSAALTTLCSRPRW